MFKIISLVCFSCVSAPVFGSGGCVLDLFSRWNRSTKQSPGVTERGRLAQRGPSFYSMDDTLSPRGLANSRRQQFVIGEEDTYFILDGKIAKKSLLADEWWFLDGLSGAKAILFHKGFLYALTESKQVYRLEWSAQANTDAKAGHKWILHNENVIKMFLNKPGELVFLLGTSKETARILAGFSSDGS